MKTVKTRLSYPGGYPSIKKGQRVYTRECSYGHEVIRAKDGLTLLYVLDYKNGEFISPIRQLKYERILRVVDKFIFRDKLKSLIE